MLEYIGKKPYETYGHFLKNSLVFLSIFGSNIGSKGQTFFTGSLIHRYLQFSFFSMSLLCNVICNVALRTTKQQQQHVQVWAFSIQKYRLITDLVWFGLVLIQVHVKQHGKKYKCTCMSYCSHECQLELQALQTLLETSAPV